MDGSMREDGTGFRFSMEIPGTRASTDAVSLTLAAGPVRDAGPRVPDSSGPLGVLRNGCKWTEVISRTRSNSTLYWSFQ